MQGVTGYGARCAACSLIKQGYRVLSQLPHLFISCILKQTCSVRSQVVLPCMCDCKQAIIFVLRLTSALSDRQLAIFLAPLQSRKFCSVSWVCHHFCAAPFRPTDLCSISTCTLQRPSYSLPLPFSSPSPSPAFCHFCSSSPPLVLVRPDLLGPTPNTQQQQDHISVEELHPWWETHISTAQHICTCDSVCKLVRSHLWPVKELCVCVRVWLSVFAWMSV